jgi:hypothetical protein
VRIEASKHQHDVLSRCTSQAVRVGGLSLSVAAGFRPETAEGRRKFTEDTIELEGLIAKKLGWCLNKR